MESSPTTGCVIRNQNDPYQFQCVFSTDPEDKRDFSVYFHSPDGKQEIMASCSHNEVYECIFTQEGLSVTGDYFSVFGTFSKQNGSFVCRNGGALLNQFPCFYSGSSVKPEVKCDMTDIGPNTFRKPEDFETEDDNLKVIAIAVCGVVIILQFLVIGFLLFKMCKDRVSSKRKKESIIFNPVRLESKKSSLNGECWETKALTHINGKEYKHYPSREAAWRWSLDKNRLQSLIKEQADTIQP